VTSDTGAASGEVIMKKVAVIPYIRKSGVVDTTRRLVDWLSARDIAISIPEVEAAELGLARYSASDRELFDGADLAVALGGDGTVLRVLRLMGDRTIPILGVNLGEMGFLMWVKAHDLETALEQIQTGRFSLEERRMLRVKIELADGVILSRVALNDVLIGREEFSRLIKLEVLINDRLFCRYAADGVLVSTPTGSTAYAFSAGGPIISPGAEVFSMVPICPHSLNNRSLVFSGHEELTIRPLADEPMTRTGVSIDGVAIHDLGPVAGITIGLAETKFKFISLNGPDFYQALSMKLTRWLGLAD
jgi:NAD+ kinase